MDEEQQLGVGSEGTLPAAEPTAQDTAMSEQTSPQGDASDEADFPEDAVAQRQAFIEMRREIKKLKQRDQVKQTETTQYGEDNYDLVNLARGVDPTYGQQPTYQPAYPSQVEFDETDPATQAFLGKAQRAEQEAAAARQEAAAARAQLEDFEAWQKYPELNPKSPNRNKLFQEDVQAQYISERLKALQTGKSLPRLIDVADKVQQRYELIRNQAQEQGAQRAKQEIADREAASLESRGTRVSIETGDDRVEQLRQRVRMGDVGALTELNKLIDPFISGLE